MNETLLDKERHLGAAIRRKRERNNEKATCARDEKRKELGFRHATSRRKSSHPHTSKHALPSGTFTHECAVFHSRCNLVPCS